MYDRAPRLRTNFAKGTSPNIGPGSYAVGDGLNSRLVGNSYAPFSSLAVRESFLKLEESNENPGPGAYEPKTFNHIKGASTVSNRTRRFTEKVDSNPGPQAYQVSRQPEENKKGSKGSDVYKKPAIQRRFGPPSIPSPGKSIGYEEVRYGVLQKQQGAAADQTLGPAYYNLHQGDTAASQKYRGIHFGKMSSKRPDFIEGEGTPGPGAYSPHIPKASKLLWDEEKKPMESKIPRYHQIIPIMENKKAVPGPGQYEIKSQFEATSQVFNAEVRPSFGSQTQRFPESKEKTPSPGAYEERKSLQSSDRLYNSKNNPFGQTSRRFNKVPSAELPGPDAYHIPDLASELQKKALLSKNLKGGFGSAADRKYMCKPKDTETLPGPAQYTVQSAPAAVARDKGSVFKSVTSRLPNPADSVPAVGSYEIDRSITKMQGFKSKIPRRAIDGGFLSSTKRFSQPRDMIVKVPDRSIPGPGEYEPKVPSTPGASIVVKTQRFEDIKNDTPGPGTYQLSPLLHHTVLKGTFNVTLGKPADGLLGGVKGSASRLSLSVNG